MEQLTSMLAKPTGMPCNVIGLVRCLGELGLSGHEATEVAFDLLRSGHFETLGTSVGKKPFRPAPN